MSHKAFKRVRAETRRKRFDRIHGEVLAGRTVFDLWLAYARARLEPYGVAINEPDVESTLRPAFYAGAAAMLELMQRVGPDDISEEQGMEMLTRLYEELDTYTKRRP